MRSAIHEERDSLIRGFDGKRWCCYGHEVKEERGCLFCVNSKDQEVSCDRGLCGRCGAFCGHEEAHEDDADLCDDCWSERHLAP